MEDFKEAYKRLNKEQKEAVDTIDGPVMVVAGPGTGKTQILALRIANILSKTDTQSDGILCLTFTNAGASQMNSRLMLNRLTTKQSYRVQCRRYINNTYLIKHKQLKKMKKINKMKRNQKRRERTERTERTERRKTNKNKSNKSKSKRMKKGHKTRNRLKTNKICNRSNYYWE
jgi:superfamily I DNA/RNA helicase